MSLPETIKARRLALKLDQEDLAELLEVAQSCVSDWESGAMTPRASKLPKLAEILKVSHKRLTREWIAAALAGRAA